MTNGLQTANKRVPKSTRLTDNVYTHELLADKKSPRTVSPVCSSCVYQLPITNYRLYVHAQTDRIFRKLSLSVYGSRELMVS